MDFDDGKSSDDIINNATMSDEAVASYGPPRSLFYQAPFVTFTDESD